MNEQRFYDLIERYLLGQMSPQERAALEAELSRNPLLAEQFAAQKLEHDAMEVLVEDSLRTRLQRWAKEYPLQKSKPWYRRQVLWLAAGLALVLGAFYFFWPSEDGRPGAPAPVAEAPAAPIPLQEDSAEVSPALSTPTQESAANPLATLAKKYTERPTFKQTIVRNERETLSDMDSAYWALEKGHYSDALRRLRKIPPGNERYITAQHLIGEVHFANGAYAEAAPFLRKAASTADYLRKSTAEWQLALAYLHVGNAKAAFALLRQIKEDVEHPYYQQAQQLLQEIENNRR